VHRQAHVVALPVELPQFCPKSSRTFRIAVWQQRSIASSRTPGRYFVTKTK
jgi:hypothetical protein